MPIIILLLACLALSGCQKTNPKGTPKQPSKQANKTKVVSKGTTTVAKDTKKAQPTKQTEQAKPTTSDKTTKPTTQDNVPLLFVAFFPPNKKINSLKDAIKHKAKLTEPQHQIVESMRLFWKTIHTKDQDITSLMGDSMVTITASNALGEEDEADKVTKIKATKGKTHYLSNCENIGPQSLAICSQSCCTFKFFPSEDFGGALHNTVDLTKVCFNSAASEKFKPSFSNVKPLPVAKVMVSVDQCDAPAAQRDQSK